MALGRAHFFFDQVEVVEQPFAGRRHAALLGALRQQRAHADQGLLVRGEPGQQAVAAWCSGQFVLGREMPAVVLHLLGREQLRAQRLIVHAGGGTGQREQPARAEQRAQRHGQHAIEPARRVHRSFVERHQEATAA
jgi:hypothetical protein